MTRIPISPRLTQHADAPPDVWALYARPLDYPAGFVLRRHAGVFATGDASYHATLTAARAAVPAGLVAIARQAGDVTSLVETWLAPAVARRLRIAATPPDAGGHRWLSTDALYLTAPGTAAYTACGLCGKVRRVDRRNKPCTGPPRITTRERAP